MDNQLDLPDLHHPLDIFQFEPMEYLISRVRELFPSFARVEPGRRSRYSIPSKYGLFGEGRSVL